MVGSSRRFVTPLKIIAASSCVGLAALAANDEGARRSLQFWWRIFPIYAHYRVYQFLDRDTHLISDEYATKKFDELHSLYTDDVKSIAYSLRGFYLKVQLIHS